MKSNFHNGDTKLPEAGGITVVIDSSNGPVTISTCQKNKFCEVSNHFCELTGWDKSETRFTLDGDRLKEMFGGIGPEEKKREENEKKIIQMLKKGTPALHPPPEQVHPAHQSGL